MRRYLAMLLLCGLLPACTQAPNENPNADQSGVISAAPGSSAPAPAAPPRNAKSGEVPGSWPDHPQTPNTAAPGVVSPPPASPAPPISTSEGP